MKKWPIYVVFTYSLQCIENGIVNLSIVIAFKLDCFGNPTIPFIEHIAVLEIDQQLDGVHPHQKSELTIVPTNAMSGFGTDPWNAS